MDARVEENFICINVADPSDQFLVEQDRFHYTTMFFQDLFELRDANVERIRTQATFPQVFIYILNQADLAEFALILECEAMCIGKNKEHSHMLGGRGGGTRNTLQAIIPEAIAARGRHQCA
jgi:hypothetical protein